MKEIILEYLETAEPDTYFEYNKKPASNQNIDIKKLSRIRSELIRVWKCKNKERINRSNFL